MIFERNRWNVCGGNAKGLKWIYEGKKFTRRKLMKLKWKRMKSFLWVRSAFFLASLLRRWDLKFFISSYEIMRILLNQKLCEVAGWFQFVASWIVVLYCIVHLNRTIGSFWLAGRWELTILDAELLLEEFELWLCLFWWLEIMTRVDLIRRQELTGTHDYNELELTTIID
jgi:hypothetical protein